MADNRTTDGPDYVTPDILRSATSYGATLTGRPIHIRYPNHPAESLFLTLTEALCRQRSEGVWFFPFIKLRKNENHL